METQRGTIVLAVVLAAGLAGCTGMDRIDARVNRLMQTRSETLGIVPNAAYPDAKQSLDSARTKSPPTTNKQASELAFTPADEARKVDDRLEGYAATSIGEIKTAAAPGESFAVAPQGAVEMALEDALKQSQLTAREYLNAQEEYFLAAIRLLIERHLWSPRFFNDTTFGVSGQADNGRFNHAADVINTLRATQRLPYGGDVEARFVYNATEQLREVSSGKYVQSSRLVLEANVPLLRGAGMVAQEGLIQAERDLVYAARTFERFRRQFFVRVCNDYFDLIQLQNQIKNQTRQLNSLRDFESSTAARVQAGREPEFNRNIVSNQVLSAQFQLANLKEQYINRVEAFRVRLGLKDGTWLAIQPLRFEIPEPEMPLDTAGRLALEYRLYLQNQRDRVEDQRRAVANRKNDLLPSLDFNADVALPTDPARNSPGLNVTSDELEYNAGLTLGLPLDREQERLALKQSLIQLEQRVREYELARDNAVVEVRASLRAVDLARLRFTLAEKQVEINRRRLEEQQLKRDTVEPQRIVDSENALLDAENSRDQARTQLRSAVLNYLLQSDQLRIDAQGRLEQIPGMTKP